jgi:hypothetical protein
MYLTQIRIAIVSVENNEKKTNEKGWIINIPPWKKKHAEILLNSTCNFRL